MTECPGCRAELPVIDGPTHRYIGASPACWDIYTRFLAGDPVTPASQLSPLLIDAYALGILVGPRRRPPSRSPSTW